MSTARNIETTIKLALSIITCQLVVIASVFLTQSDSNYWYNMLILPTWKLTIAFFGSVWSILSFLMGISIWIIWTSGKHKSMKKYTIAIFIIQLFLSFLWSILIFNYHSQPFAFLVILILIVLLILCVIEFSKISKLAAWLLVPSLCWVCFEAVLNFKILFLNDYGC
jgi:translocator protein